MEEKPLPLQGVALRREDFHTLIGPKHLDSFRPVIGTYNWLVLEDGTTVVSDIGPHSTQLFFRKHSARNLVEFRQKLLDFDGEEKRRFIEEQRPHVVCGGSADENGVVVSWGTNGFGMTDTPEKLKGPIQELVTKIVRQYFHEREVTSGKFIRPPKEET